MRPLALPACARNMASLAPSRGPPSLLLLLPNPVLLPPPLLYLYVCPRLYQHRFRRKGRQYNFLSRSRAPGLSSLLCWADLSFRSFFSSSLSLFVFFFLGSFSVSQGKEIITVGADRFGFNSIVPIDTLRKLYLVRSPFRPSR